MQVYQAGKQVFEMTGVDLTKLERSIEALSDDITAILGASHPAVVPKQAMLRFEDGQACKIVSKLLQFGEELRRELHPQVSACGDPHSMCRVVIRAVPCDKLCMHMCLPSESIPERVFRVRAIRI
jgi:hypothetical protein